MESDVPKIDQASCRPQEIIEIRLARFATGSMNLTSVSGSNMVISFGPEDSRERVSWYSSHRKSVTTCADKISVLLPHLL